ncbi:DEAD/DEAH box helicase [Abyssisolibacter fermentans]|uniref:DEAD/DEAH box helicase n=1 Tax=Abyssisolibacter fermentans TaxID=1766203 RepID=UPI00082ED50C|nr:DEAD/DEAH box helicase [Abyssisolibacter fermentans]
MDTKEMKIKDYPLSNEIKRGLSELGFKKPLEVQAIVIPKILEEDRDLIVQSQTGSGKTAAFGIPICEKINAELESTQMLVLTPTRELAEQVKYDIEGIGKYKGIKCVAVYGKQPIEIQRKELKKKPHVIVATPGRMMDHLFRKNVKLKDLKYLVIDEADEMLIMGFGEQIEKIIEKTPDDRVTLLFSATMPLEAQYLSQKYLKNPENIEVKSDNSVLNKIEQIHYTVEALKKVDFLKMMLRREAPRKTIIFCNTQEQVERLYAIMKKWSYLICRVHGGMKQLDRMNTMTAFKRGQYNTMIATDVAARGIHVERVTHVINFFVPFDNENYIHRIGRTGRVDQNGVAITFVTKPEVERFEELQKFLGYKIPCKGGHVSRKIGKKEQKRLSKKNRYIAGNKKGVIVQLNAGNVNSIFTKRDIISTLRSISGINQSDIGKIEIKGKVTNIEILGGKERIVYKAFSNIKINGKKYRAKLKS